MGKVYEGFMEEIDAIDNGISTHEGEGRYTIHTNLSRRVGNLSPRWTDPEQARFTLLGGGGGVKKEQSCEVEILLAFHADANMLVLIIETKI